MKHPNESYYSVATEPSWETEGETIVLLWTHDREVHDFLEDHFTEREGLVPRHVRHLDDAVPPRYVIEFDPAVARRIVEQALSRLPEDALQRVAVAAPKITEVKAD